MNYFDIIFLIVFIWSAYRGITKGFVVMAASLAALIVGIWEPSVFRILHLIFCPTILNLKLSIFHW